MIRRWAVLLIAAAALGCRSSQPTTNPFLRTTVPPPGTGQGAVVVPGEPYYPGGAPPATTAPLDPAAAPVVPITPPPAAAPPAVPLRNNKYSPPGGSYIYNQSSIDRPKGRGAEGGAADSELAAASGGEKASQPQSLDELRLPTVEHAVADAKRLSVEPDIVELAHADGSEPPPSVAAAIAAAMPDHITSPDAALEQSAAAIAPEPSHRDGTAVAVAKSSDSSSTGTTVLRITAGAPAGGETAGSRLAIKQDDATSVANPETSDQFARNWAGSQPSQGVRRSSTGAGASAWRSSASRAPLGPSAL